MEMCVPIVDEFFFFYVCLWRIAKQRLFTFYQFTISFVTQTQTQTSIEVYGSRFQTPTQPKIKLLKMMSRGK